MTMDLGAIKARLAAATPGPWRSPWESDDEYATFTGPDGAQVVDVTYYDGSRIVVSEANAALIANAPTDLAALVAEVERLRRKAAHVPELVSMLAEARTNAWRMREALTRLETAAGNIVGVVRTVTEPDEAWCRWELGQLDEAVVAARAALGGE